MRVDKSKWKKCTLGDVCNLYQPKTIAASSLDSNGKYLVYGANGVIGTYNEYNHAYPEILITCRGATCGSINISKPFSWINGNAMVVHPKKENLFDFAFLGRVVSAIDYSKVITGAAQPQITRTNLQKIKIVIPSFPEQQAIAAELDAVQEMIDGYKTQITSLDALTQSIFLDTFGDPITNPKGWIGKVFSDCFSLKSGDGLSAKQFIEGDYPVYGGNGIAGYHNQYNKNGDYVIIGRVGAKCGNVRYVEGKFWLTDNAFELSQKETLFENIFLVNLLLLLNLGSKAKVMAQPVISNVSLKDVQVFLPSLELQQNFATQVEAIEKQKDLLRQQLADAETLMAERMQYYFS